MPPKTRSKVGEGSSSNGPRQAGPQQLLQLINSCSARPVAPTLATNGDGPETVSATNSIPMEITTVETTDSEDDSILDEPAQKKSLLALRQLYKRTRNNLARVTSHLAFIETCMGKEKTPKGVRVNVYCNAVLADLTNVKTKFVETKEKAEHSYVEALRSHYRTAKVKLTKDLEAVEKEIRSTVRQASLEEVQEHKAMMDKTMENLDKLEKTLEDRKKQKVESLTSPAMRNRQDRRSRPYNPPPNPTTRYGQTNQQRKSTRPPNRRGPPKPTQVIHTQQQPPPQSAQQTAEINNLAGLLNQLLKNAPAHTQQPPPLLMNPCAPGLQPPPLLAPRVNPPPGLPPMQFGRGQQGF